MDENKKAVFVSIVIPIYNEENRIENFLSDVINFLKREPFSYEIIVVDDGSTDSTVKVTDTILEKNVPGRYKLLRLSENLGKGGAVRKGMLEAGGEYIFFIDADGSTSIVEIDKFITHFSPEFDIYIAVRTIKHEAPFKRQFFGYGYIFLANIFLQMNVSDFTCGFKCYRHDIAQEIFSRQTLNNWSFDAEDLYITKKYGYKVKEIPVYWKHVEGSKVKVLKNVIICGFDLLRIRYNDICGKYDKR
jgi:dolichyl-phosphate beta-glucosyltransferase